MQQLGVEAGQATDPTKKLTKKDIDFGSKEANTQVQKLKSDLEELQKVQLSKEKADEILEKLKTLKASEKVVGQSLVRLETGLRLILQDPKDTAAIEGVMGEDKQEIERLQETILGLKKELFEITEKSGAIQRSAETLKSNQLTKQEIEQFKTIKNIDFLKLSPQERLRFITVGNIDAKQVVSGDKKNLEFTFTYDGVFNRDFYIRTTAGQVLPPEVRELKAGDEVYTRNGLNGEFFTSQGKRLKIHEGTKLDVSNIAKPEDLAKLSEAALAGAKEYEGKPEHALAVEALKKGIDPKFAILTYGEAFKAVPEAQRKEWIEDKLTDIARYQDDFADERPGEKAFEAGKVTEAFAGYMTNTIGGNVQAVATAYGFKPENLNRYRKESAYKWGGAINIQDVNVDGITQEEKDRVLKMKKFTPGSKEAIILFTLAAKAAKFPPEWGKNSELHRILSRESNGIVGRLNYTIPKSYSPEEFKRLSLERRNNNPIGVKSTASGLGQLLLSNVDKYYPSGRNGIGDALNEAVWMLRYIHDRYGSPEVAGQAYGRECTYVHAVTGKSCKKWFREGY